MSLQIRYILTSFYKYCNRIRSVYSGAEEEEEEEAFSTSEEKKKNIHLTINITRSSAVNLDVRFLAFDFEEKIIIQDNICVYKF